MNSYFCFKDHDYWFSWETDSLNSLNVFHCSVCCPVTFEMTRIQKSPKVLPIFFCSSCSTLIYDNLSSVSDDELKQRAQKRRSLLVFFLKCNSNLPSRSVKDQIFLSYMWNEQGSLNSHDPLITVSFFMTKTLFKPTHLGLPTVDVLDHKDFSSHSWLCSTKDDYMCYLFRIVAMKNT